MNHRTSTDPQYRVCTRCVMDTTVDPISFDENGICIYCKVHDERVSLAPVSKPDAPTKLGQVIARIKTDQKGEYDSIVGLSGGVDSSYVAYQAVQHGLKPLAVHFDNGWNSELAVKNIERIVERLGLDLMTFVIDWEEFRDIQRSFFKANVIDIEMVTDHAIFAALFQIARRHRIKYLLSGTNVATESVVPPTWQHFKFDLRNLKSIHQKHGTMKISRYPTMSVWGMALNHYVRGIQSISLLNYLPYRKDMAMEILKAKTGWQYYGGKHYESTFTKFYQAHILPKKFGIDKRRMHLSDLIMNNEITRDQAIKELDAPLYSDGNLEQDVEYVCKKLGFSRQEFQLYMTTPPASHFDYPSHAKLGLYLSSLHKRLRYK